MTESVPVYSTGWAGTWSTRGGVRDVEAVRRRRTRRNPYHRRPSGQPMTRDPGGLTARLGPVEPLAVVDVSERDQARRIAADLALHRIEAARRRQAADAA